MKRYISMAVALIMVCSMIVPLCVHAEINTDAVEAMNFLRNFGIIQDYYDYNTSFNEEIKRGEFIDAVANLIGLSDYVGTEVHYYDVPKTHYAYDSICALSELGIINGTGDNLFEPDAIIDDTAAYKILLTAMGWGDWAYYNGGYPAGYIAASKKAEINLNSSSENVTLDEMFLMLYNAATGIVLEEVRFSGDGSVVTMKISENETLLSIYHDIYNDEGMVTTADMISITDEYVGEKDEVIIDGVMYGTEIDVSEYIGREIEFFYRDDKNSSKKTLVWASSQGTTDVLKIDVDNDAHFDENSFVYTYAKGERNSKINLSKNMVLIYNGKIVADNYSEILNKPRYTAEFLKTDNGYGTVIVKGYENYVADTIDVTNKIVYDKFDSAKALSLNEQDYEYVSVERAGGTEISVNEIKAGDVLSAFISQDKRRLEIIVESQTRTGVVSKISTGDEKCVITIDESSYYLPIEKYSGEFGAGDTIRIYIDYTGMIAAAEIEKSGNFAAYVLDYTVEQIFEEKLKLKMFAQDGNIGIYETADKVTVDGKSGCEPTDIIDALTGEEGFESQLVLAGTDGDGKIRSIDTAYVNSVYENPSASLVQNMPLKMRHYKIQGYFYTDAAIDGNTVIFAVPEDSKDPMAENVCQIMRKTDLPDDTTYNVMSYNTTDRNGYEDFVVIKRTHINDFSRELPLLVTEKGEMINSEGNTVACLTGYRGVDEVSVCSDGELSFDEVTEGMLIRFRYSITGDAAAMTILYDPANKEKYYTQSVPFNSIYGIEVGFVNDIIGDVIKIGYNSGANVNNVRNLYGSPVILIYDDEQKNPVYQGTFGDAKRYYNVKDDCSQVVMISSHCTPKLYVFYN